MTILIPWCLYLPWIAIYRYSRLELFHPEQKEDNKWTKAIFAIANYAMVQKDILLFHI